MPTRRCSASPDRARPTRSPTSSRSSSAPPWCLPTTRRSPRSSTASSSEFFPTNAVEYFVSYYDYYQPEAYVPSSDTYIEKDSSINEHIEQMRLSATKALLERSDSIIVATVSAIYGLGDPQAYLAMVLHLVRGDLIDQRKLLRRLADMQYTRNELDLRQGTYRVRGDVIDIFPAESEREAVRVELFDDRIDSLTLFRSAHRRDLAQGAALHGVPRHALRDAQGAAHDALEPDQGRAARAAERAARRRASWSRRSGWSSAPCSTWR